MYEVPLIYADHIDIQGQDEHLQDHWSSGFTKSHIYNFMGMFGEKSPTENIKIKLILG